MSSCHTTPLPRLIYQTSLGLQGHADLLLKPFDLTLEQFHSLKTVMLEGGAVGQRHLCNLVAKTPANMTRILDRLALKKFIKRQPDAQDRRAFIIKITQPGEEIVNEVSGIFDDYLKQILGGISADNQEVCRKVLGQINHNLALITAAADS